MDVIGSRNTSNFYFRVQRSCSIRSGPAYIFADEYTIAGMDALDDDDDGGGG